MHLSSHMKLIRTSPFSPSGLLAVKAEQSAGSVCRHGLRKSPSPPPTGSAHTSAAWETTNTTLVISSVLPAAEGLHKKNPWTSDYFLKHLSPQIFQQTNAGLVPVRPGESCFLVCPATFLAILAPHSHPHPTATWHTCCLVGTVFWKPSAYAAVMQL